MWKSALATRFRCGFSGSCIDGGTLETKSIRRNQNDHAIIFNGGTLKANGTSGNGLIYSSTSQLTVWVNARGGTIDCGGNAVTISLVNNNSGDGGIRGSGGLTFTGGNTITLNAGVFYSGATAVTPGTTLAIANATAKTNILKNGLVVAGVPTADQTILTYTSAFADSDLDKISCPLAPATTFKFSDEGKTNIVVDVVGPVINYWTGAVDNDLSKDGNWSLGTKPSGTANIFCTASTTLAKGSSFAPTSITFLEGSAAVTIDGDFTSLTAITNNSSLNQTFAGFVDFGSNNINVKQTAAVTGTATDPVSGGCVVFAGGVRGVDIVNHAVLTGDYTLTKESAFNASSRLTINANSKLFVKKTDQLQELDIRSGATFTVENGSINWSTDGNTHRLWCWNRGLFVATNYTFTGTGGMWLGGYLSSDNGRAGNVNPILKIGALNSTGTGRLWLHGYGGNGASSIYVGAGGINLTSTGYVGVENSDHPTTLWPWKSDYTIGSGNNADYDLRIGNASNSGGLNVCFQRF